MFTGVLYFILFIAFWVYFFLFLNAVEQNDPEAVVLELSHSDGSSDILHDVKCHM